MVHKSTDMGDDRKLNVVHEPYDKLRDKNSAFCVNQKRGAGQRLKYLAAVEERNLYV